MSVKIGLEIHAELKTRTKLFCSCAREDTAPNTRTCPICLGHPGSRPVTSKAAIEMALTVCTALECTAATTLHFARKSYFYPDLSKNYQITQTEPLGAGGKLRTREGTVSLKGLHIEEDPAAIVRGEGVSLLDYNRSGRPLIEIVTEPVITSPQEAREVLRRLATLLRYLDVHDDSCVMKADANVSIEATDWTRVEIKNISGFKDVEKALTFEITRQRAHARQGLPVVQETRGWTGKATVTQRRKEDAEDYGYIDEPDLPPIPLSFEVTLPELPHQRAARFQKEYSLTEADADVLTSDPELAALFERFAARFEPRFAAQWLRHEVLRVLNYTGESLSSMDEEQLASLLAMVHERRISDRTGQQLLERLSTGPFDPEQTVTDEGLGLLTDEQAIRDACATAIKEHAQAVADYHAGEEKAFHYILGQVMKATKGKAEPEQTRRILSELL